MVKLKGRPKKTRLVESEPKIQQFSPRGRPGRPDEVVLSLDQYEAIRLADYSGLQQVQAAKLMGISRPTFGRIIKEARYKVSNALLYGKIIKIEGGNVKVG